MCVPNSGSSGSSARTLMSPRTDFARREAFNRPRSLSVQGFDASLTHPLGPTRDIEQAGHVGSPTSKDGSRIHLKPSLVIADTHKGPPHVCNPVSNLHTFIVVCNMNTTKSIAS